MKLRICLILGLLMIGISCEEEPVVDVKRGSKKVVPEGTSIKTGTVSSDYDLEGLNVISTYDQSVINDGSFEIIVDNALTPIYIVDENEDLIAQVSIEAGIDEITIDRSSVTKSLLEISPNYNLLKSYNSETLDDIVNNNEYKSIENIVDKKLGNRSPLFAFTEVEIELILEIDALIQNNLIKDIQGGRLFFERMLDASDWLYEDNIGAYIENNEFAYSGARIIELKSNRVVKEFMLAPNNFNPLIADTKYHFNSLQDDYYLLEISQKTEAVNQENKLKIGLDLLQWALGSALNNSFKNSECITAVTSGSLVDVIRFNALEADLENPNDLVPIIKEAALQVLSEVQTILGTKDCQKFIAQESGRIISKAIASKVVAAIAIYNTIESWANIGSTALALAFPLEDDEVFQLHISKLIEGSLAAEKDLSSIPESNEPNSIIYPTVNILPKTYYEEIELDGIKVDWTLLEGSGSLTLSQTTSNEEGEAIVEWTLPAVDGEYFLRAEVKDKEGDLIEGGLIEFKAVVQDGKFVFDVDGNKYTVLEIGDQKWLKENLKALHFNDGTKAPRNDLFYEIGDGLNPEYLIDEEGFKDKYGILYSMNIVLSNKQICPAGFEVPTKEDWWVLLENLGGKLSYSSAYEEFLRTYDIDFEILKEHLNDYNLVHIGNDYRTLNYFGEQDFGAHYWSSSFRDQKTTNNLEVAIVTSFGFGFIPFKIGTKKETVLRDFQDLIKVTDAYPIRCIKD